jgi:hypothetical protein
MKNCRWQRLRLPLPDDRPAEEAGFLLGVGMGGLHGLTNKNGDISWDISWDVSLVR